MMKCSIAVAYPEALATAPFLYRGDWKEIIEQAHGSGFDAVELHIRRPDSVRAEELLHFAGGAGNGIFRRSHRNELHDGRTQPDG